LTDELKNVSLMIECCVITQWRCI